MKMKNNKRSTIYLIFLLLLVLVILINPVKCVSLAAEGLMIWFQRMIPSLLPFMILSGIMVRMQLTESMASLVHIFIGPLWKVRKNVSYTILMGFLCGFPMGAKVTRELYDRKGLTGEEAELTFAFCNNIGPVYVIGFVLPLLQRKLLWPYLIGMYGIPFFYGFYLRYTKYRCKLPTETEYKYQTDNRAMKPSLLYHLDDAIAASVESILMLGGYMISFQILQMIPELIAEGIVIIWPETVNISPKLSLMLSPLIEIGGGIVRAGEKMPLWCLLMLPFGGLCCFAQTYSIMKNSGLSMKGYLFHKGILTGITLLYYLMWYLIHPETFLL